MKLSAHFTLEELTVSETAQRHGLRNLPSDKHMINLRRLVETLEDVRELLDHKPILITSGYRSPQLNRLVGGTMTSMHMLGLAADFICPGFGTPLEICQELKPHLALLKIDQLIYEYEAWVHLGLTNEGEHRLMALTLDRRGMRDGFG